MNTLIKAGALLAGAVSITVLSGCESSTKNEGFKGELNAVSQTAVAANASTTGFAPLAVIPAFERTISQTDTPIDRYLAGDKKALSTEQVRGKAIFEGKGGCIQCHNGALAYDMEMYNIGVPPAKRWEEDGLAQITFRFELYAKGSNEELYRTAKGDPGAYFRGKNKWDLGKFRMPSLRGMSFAPRNIT